MFLTKTMKSLILLICVGLFFALPLGSDSATSSAVSNACHPNQTACPEVQPGQPNKFVNGLNGHDSKTCGPPGNRCKTIQQAITNAVKGDVIEVAVGDYQPISIPADQSGIQLIGQNEHGLRPRIISQAATLVLIQAKDILFSGFEITNGDGFLKKCTAVDGKDKHCSSGSTGISVESGSQNVVIANNNIHHIGMDYLSACGKKQEEIMKCWGDSRGIDVQSDIEEHKPGTETSCVTIVGNTLSNLHLGTSEGITIGGNVKEFQVHDNTIESLDNIAIDITGKWHQCLDKIANPDCQAKKGTISANSISFVFASLDQADLHFNPGQKDEAGKLIMMGAIYVDGGTCVVIERNTVHDSATGIDVGSEKGATVENIVVRSNLVYANKAAGIKIGSDNDQANLNASSFVNNTLINNTSKSNTGSILFGQASVKHFGNIAVANNLVSNENSRWLVANVDSKCIGKKSKGKKCDSPLLFIKNGFYSPAKNNFHNGSKSSTYDSFTALFDDQPLAFEPIALDNFHLPGASLFRDAGDNSLFPDCEKDPRCLDRAGKPRIVNGKIDLGAFEFQ